MKCILCLRNFGNNTNPHVKIFSGKGKELEARHVIEKHFWMQADERDADRSLICRFCWKTLIAFHKFYVRIENMHNSLEEVKVKHETMAEFIFCSSTLSQKEDKNVDNTVTMISPDHLNPMQEPMVVEKRIRKRSKSEEEFMHENLNSSVHAEEEQDTVIDEITLVSPKRNPNDEELSYEDFNTSVFGGNGTDDDENVHPQNPIEYGAEVQKRNIKLISRKRGRPRKVKGMKKMKVKIKEDETTAVTAADNDTSKTGISDLILKKNTQKFKKQKLAKPPPRVHPKSLEFDDIIAKNFKLICCLCQAVMPNFTQLKMHFRTEHKTRGYVRCCGAKLLKRGLLVDHIFTHQNPNYFSCTKCNKVLATRRSLELHIQRHEADRSRVYQCDVCSKSYFNHVVYMRHLQLHAPEEEKNIPCSQCGKTFVTKYNMTQHFRLVHLNLYAKVCDICGKSIRGNSAFERHRLLHEGHQLPPIVCEICGITLTTKYGLARHLKLRHTEKYTRPQKCTICSKISPNVAAHNCHMKYVHSMERKHACTLCDKAFKRPKDLREHMTTHTGEVLYTCTHCPKTFNSNANMYAHRKRAHPKEWAENRQKRLPHIQTTIPTIENIIDCNIETIEECTTQIANALSIDM